MAIFSRRERSSGTLSTMGGTSKRWILRMELIKRRMVLVSSGASSKR